MTYFLKNGNTFRTANEAALDIHNKLPAGNYVIKEDAFGNLFFELVDSFSVSFKRYGDNIKNTDRIFNTFLHRESATGVLLSGEKGSGKSLLAKTIAIKANEHDMPTILINHPYCGDKFNTLIQSIEQPAVILFDEFEKVYEENDQESILTLLDGVFQSKKLFIFTVNDKYRIDSHMKNRPGRIFYLLEFTGLSQDFIVEYCNDMLDNKNHIDTICRISTLFHEFNFDILKALVEELNRYGETPQEALKMLNAKPEFGASLSFDIEMIDSNGVAIPDNEFDNGPRWRGNPLSDTIRIEHYHHINEEEGSWVYASFTPFELTEMNANSGKFVFVNKHNQKLTLTKQKSSIFNYYDAF